MPAHAHDRQRINRSFRRRFNGPWGSAHQRPTHQESITGDGQAATVFQTLANTQDFLPVTVASDLSRRYL